MFGLLAQLVEQYTFNVRVDGSSPSGLTSTSRTSLSSSRPRTPPFHGGDGGSNPPGDATFLVSVQKALLQGRAFFYSFFRKGILRREISVDFMTVSLYVSWIGQCLRSSVVEQPIRNEFFSKGFLGIMRYLSRA